MIIATRVQNNTTANDGEPLHVFTCVSHRCRSTETRRTASDEWNIPVPIASKSYEIYKISEIGEGRKGEGLDDVGQLRPKC